MLALQLEGGPRGLSGLLLSGHQRRELSQGTHEIGHPRNLSGFSHNLAYRLFKAINEALREVDLSRLGLVSPAGLKGLGDCPSLVVRGDHVRGRVAGEDDVTTLTLVFMADDDFAVLIVLRAPAIGPVLPPPRLSTDGLFGPLAPILRNTTKS